MYSPTSAGLRRSPLPQSKSFFEYLEGLGRAKLQAYQTRVVSPQYICSTGKPSSLILKVGSTVGSPVGADASVVGLSVGAGAGAAVGPVGASVAGVGSALGAAVVGSALVGGIDTVGAWVGSVVGDAVGEGVGERVLGGRDVAQLHTDRLAERQPPRRGVSVGERGDSVGAATGPMDGSRHRTNETEGVRHLEQEELAKKSLQATGAGRPGPVAAAAR